MKTLNFKKAEKVYPMLKEIEMGEIFTFPDSISPFIRGFMRENDKPKVINLMTGEIINASLTIRVVPYDANIDLIPKV